MVHCQAFAFALIGLIPTEMGPADEQFVSFTPSSICPALKRFVGQPERDVHACHRHL